MTFIPTEASLTSNMKEVDPDTTLYHHTVWMYTRVLYG